MAIGWVIYNLSNAPLALGIVGIAQFFPMLLLTLPAGELCDRISPQPVLVAGLAAQCLCALAFAILATLSSHAEWPFYAVLVVFGAARAFTDPAGQALLPLLVLPERLPSAIAWNSTAWQVAVIAGPALGGLACGIGPGIAFASCAFGFLMAMLCIAVLSGRRPAPGANILLKDRIARVANGIGFIRSQPIVLGAISLDLFAVLFGGATALLPIYARDILHVGPTGSGAAAERSSRRRFAHCACSCPPATRTTCRPAAVRSRWCVRHLHAGLRHVDFIRVVTCFAVRAGRE